MKNTKHWPSNLHYVSSTWGYRWNNDELLLQALTHSSYGNKHRIPHSERLEFLGDSVLDVLAADHLFTKYPDKREGFMSQQRAEMVRMHTLAKISKRIGVDCVLLVEEKDTYLRRTDSVLADALEALVGAVYLDSGRQLEAARQSATKWGIIK